MEQSPSWEAKWFSAGQETPRISWNPKVLYHILKCPPPVPILSQLDPVHTLTSYFLKIHYNIILPPMPGSPQWSLSLKFLHQNPVYVSCLTHTCYMPRPPYSSRFDHPNNIGWGVQIIKLLIMQFSLFSCYLIPLWPKYTSQHPILKHPQSTSFLTVSGFKCLPFINTAWHWIWGFKGSRYSQVAN